MMHEAKRQDSQYCTIPYAGITLIKCIDHALSAMINWV